MTTTPPPEGTTEPPIECVAVDRDERCLCPGGPASHRPSPPAPAAEDDAVEKAARVWHAEDATEPRAWDALSDDERGWYIATTRKSLDAAGVSALPEYARRMGEANAELRAEVERLTDLLHTVTNDATARDARREVAERQVAALRAGIESVQKAIENNRGIDRAWDALNALLAGSGDVENPAPSVATSEGRDKVVATSGEQPGPLKAGVMALTGLSSGEVDALGGVREDARPAPVVHNHGPDDGPGLSCREERLPDGSLRGECIAPAVPDSTGLRGRLWEAIVKVRDAAPRLPDDADTDDIVDAVLAVVGQGVTAEQAWDEGWKACASAAGTASPHHNGPRNPYRVRPGEQGGEDRG